MFLSSVVTVIALYCAISNANRIRCGIQADGYEPTGLNLRIMNGQDAIPHSWPWMITQRWNDRRWCGGTLLRVRPDVEASDIVLTAGHCVYNTTTKADMPWSWIAIANVHQLPNLGGTESRNVINVTYPPEYVTATIGHDLALLKLDTPIQFTDKIRPICLPRQGEAVPTSKQCVVAGWGATGSSGSADTLQQLKVPVHPSQKCTQIARWSTFTNSIKICAGPLDGSAATCTGDSGGPLMCREGDGPWIQYGLVSHGLGGSCTVGKKPTAYTRISRYVNWIEATMRQMSSII